MQKIINGLQILLSDPRRIFEFFKNKILWKIVTYFSMKYKLSIVYRHILGFEIFLSGKNNIVEQEVVLKGGFEDYLVNFYARNLQNDSIFFDIGCNFGLFSLIGGFKIKDGIIYSFDADINMINLIDKSVTLNKYKNISIINTAVSSEDGFIDFNIVDDPAFNSIGKVEGYKLLKKIHIPSIKLDSFIQDKNLSKIDFIKIDIEGAELSALKGGESLLKKFKPILSIEVSEKTFSVFGYSSKDLINYMQSLDYIVYNYRSSILEKEIIQQEYLYDNLIFIHKDSQLIIL